MTFQTADLYDEHEGLARVPLLQFRSFGGRASFSGEVRTIKCFEDNSLIKAASAEPGEGRVLVVDGGGSFRCALMGDLIAAAFTDHGWAGVVIWGAVRDSDALGAMNLGVKALGTTPRKSVRRAQRKEKRSSLHVYMSRLHNKLRSEICKFAFPALMSARQRR